MDLLFGAAATILGSPADSTPASQPSPSIPGYLTIDGTSTQTYRRKRRCTYEDLRNSAKDLHDMGDPRVQKLLSILESRNLRRFCVREFFYGSIDADYYKDNEFVKCLEILGLSHLSALSRFEWSIVRGVMGVEIGRPRRFSRSFLEGERLKLRAYRMSKRFQTKAQPTPTSSSSSSASSSSTSTIRVGDSVTVCDMNTSSFSRGLVLSTVEPLSPRPRYFASPRMSLVDRYFEVKEGFLVQMERPELGVSVYDDVDISVDPVDIDGIEDANGSLTEAVVASKEMNPNLSRDYPFDRQTRAVSSGSGFPAAGSGILDVARSSSSSSIGGGGSSSQCTEIESSDTSASTPTSESANGDSEGGAGRVDRKRKHHPTSSANAAATVERDMVDVAEAGAGAGAEIDPEMIARCTAAVRRVWPDCLAAAEKFVDRSMESLSADEVSTVPNGRVRELIVRSVGGLLLLRDAKGKWIPKYAEPVLNALVDGICEGLNGSERRMMMKQISKLLI